MEKRFDLVVELKNPSKILRFFNLSSKQVQYIKSKQFRTYGERVESIKTIYSKRREENVGRI